jgi:predicted RNA-binding Zn-ribbon protein involved in translation (DUF1610 family)
MSGYCLACKEPVTAKIKEDKTTLLCKKCGCQIIYHSDEAVKTITKEEYMRTKNKKVE